MTTISFSRRISPVRGQGWIATFRAALNLRAQRKALKKLDDRALTDLGLTRAEALREANRVAWDVPTGWLRSHSC